MRHRSEARVGASAAWEQVRLQVVELRWQGLKAVAERLRERLGGEGLGELARYIQASREAAVFVGAGGEPAAVALYEARGNVARAQAWLSEAKSPQRAGPATSSPVTEAPFDGVSPSKKAVPTEAPIRNVHLAGSRHPLTGVPFDAEGYPDFRAAGVVRAEVKIVYTGSRARDFAAANKAAGLRETPKGMTWHHHQDRTSMQLVPTEIHAKTGHTGGFSGEP
jgi:hypothetical protein